MLSVHWKNTIVVIWAVSRFLVAVLTVFHSDIERVVDTLAIQHPSRYAFQRVNARAVALNGCDNTKPIHLVNHT